MKLQMSATRLVFGLALTVIIIGFSAFSQKGKSSPNSFRKTPNAANIDTPTPLLHDRYLRVGDLDKIETSIRKLEVQMEKLNEQMKKMDFNKVQKDVNDALEKVDFEKLERQINESMRKIDFEKIRKDIKERSVNVEQLERMKTQMAATHAQIERQREDIALNRGEYRLNIDKAMRNARESMAKAREELQNLRDFTTELEKDGLINKTSPHKIEVRSGQLFINDKKQPNEVNEKYRKYYRKQDFTINLNEEGIRI